MDFKEIDDLTSPENKAKAEKAAANQKQAEIDLARAYNRCFKSTEGQKVLTDLTQRMIYNNDVPLDAPNITYEAGYKNGEAGCVKFIIHQITRAEVI